MTGCLGLMSSDILLEPFRLHEREVLQEPSQIGAGIDGAPSSVHIAKSSEFLHESRSQTVEHRAELFDFASQLGSIAV